MNQKNIINYKDFKILLLLVSNAKENASTKLRNDWYHIVNSHRNQTRL